MSQFLNGALRRLTPYTPGEQPRNQAYIKLNTNESPYPPSPGVLAALNRAEGEPAPLLRPGSGGAEGGAGGPVRGGA
ncbi:MAG: hypothetical protein ACLRIS_06050 [Flavonifractor plautii]